MIEIMVYVGTAVGLFVAGVAVGTTSERSYRNYQKRCRKHV